MNGKSLSLLDVDQIIRRAGAQRVGEDASIRLRDILEDSAKEIAFQAKLLASHAGRKQVTKEDVLLAAELKL